MMLKSIYFTLYTRLDYSMSNENSNCFSKSDRKKNLGIFRHCQILIEKRLKKRISTIFLRHE